MYSTDFVV